jgi:tetratricopeptide (TPR) repeat protein
MMIIKWMKMAGRPALWIGLMVMALTVSSAWADYVNNAVTNPNDATYWLDQGGLFATYGNYKAAVAAYQKALTLDANSSKAYFNLAVAHTELGELDQALAEINRAIALDPGQDRYYYGRAWLLLRLGRKGEAMDSFHKAADMGSLDAIAYLQK